MKILDILESVPVVDSVEETESTFVINGSSVAKTEEAVCDFVAEQSNKLMQDFYDSQL